MTISAIQLLLVADLVADLPVAVRLQRLVGSLRAHFGCGAVALLAGAGAPTAGGGGRAFQ